MKTISFRRGMSLLLRSKTGTLGMIIVATLIFIAVFAPWLAPYDLAKVNPSALLKRPSWGDGGSSQYLLGTDCFSDASVQARQTLLYIGLIGGEPGSDHTHTPVDSFPAEQAQP